jgi:CubicO group peptidase (beta-lactamase class C family)
LTNVRVLTGFDPAGVPQLRAPRRPITLHHLLTHTAGYGYAVWNAELRRYEKYADLPRTRHLQERRAEGTARFRSGR